MSMRLSDPPEGARVQTRQEPGVLKPVYTTLVLMWDFVASCTVSTRLMGLVEKVER